MNPTSDCVFWVFLFFLFQERRNQASKQLDRTSRSGGATQADQPNAEIRAGRKNKGAGIALDQSLMAGCGTPQPVPQAVQMGTIISQQILHCRLVEEVLQGVLPSRGVFCSTRLGIHCLTRSWLSVHVPTAEVILVGVFVLVATW